MPPSLRYQFVEVVREARPDPNAQSLTSPHPGEHLGNFDDRVWGVIRDPYQRVLKVPPRSTTASVRHQAILAHSCRGARGARPCGQLSTGQNN